MPASWRMVVKEDSGGPDGASDDEAVNESCLTALALRDGSR